MSLFDNQPPAIHRLLDYIADVDRLHLPDPRQDGLMPVILAQYRSVLPMVRAREWTRVIAARGPLALAAHLMESLTEFLVAMKTDPLYLPALSHEAGPWRSGSKPRPTCCRGGAMVLDDIMGFMGEEDYLQFAHPYLKEVLSLPGTLKILHDDTPNPRVSASSASWGSTSTSPTRLRSRAYGG